MPDFVNYNNEDINFAAFGAVVVEDTAIPAKETTDQLVLKSGSNVTLIPDPETKEVVIDAVIPESHPASDIVQDSDHRFVTDQQITSWNNAAAGGVTVDTALSATSENPVQNKVVTAALDVKASTAVATTSENGLMSATDKTKLDGITYSSVAPAAPGTASAGTSSSVSRADHVHPVQTSVTGNAGTATKLENSVRINGMNFDGSRSLYNFSISEYWITENGIIYTEIDTSRNNFHLAEGAEITLYFEEDNPTGALYLKLDVLDEAKPIMYKNRTTDTPVSLFKAGTIHTFRYTSGYFKPVGEPHHDYYTFGICNDASNNSSKSVARNGFAYYNGATITVKFVNGNTISPFTLKVGDGDSVPVRYKNKRFIFNEYIKPQTYHTFRYTHNNTTGDRYWELVGNYTEILHGKASISTASANGVTSISCTFEDENGEPVTFSSAPTVIATAQSASPKSIIEEVTVNNITTTGFICYFYRTNTSSTTIQWVAINNK